MRVVIFELTETKKIVKVNDWLQKQQNPINVKFIKQSIGPDGKIIITVWYEQRAVKEL